MKIFIETFPFIVAAAIGFWAQSSGATDVECFIAFTVTAILMKTTTK